MSARKYTIPVGTKLATYFNMSPTFRDLVDFVMANKGTKTFLGYSDERILEILARGFMENTYYYEQGLDGRIVGFILAEVDENRKLVFVTENLAMTLDRLARFTAKLMMDYPGYKMEAYRHGKLVKFNLNKLYSKLI